MGPPLRPVVGRALVWEAWPQPGRGGGPRGSASGPESRVQLNRFRLRVSVRRPVYCRFFLEQAAPPPGTCPRPVTQGSAGVPVGRGREHHEPSSGVSRGWRCRWLRSRPPRGLRVPWVRPCSQPPSCHGPPPLHQPPPWPAPPSSVPLARPLSTSQRWPPGTVPSHVHPAQPHHVTAVRVTGRWLCVCRLRDSPVLQGPHPQVCAAARGLLPLRLHEELGAHLRSHLSSAPKLPGLPECH